jgi:hypothetical protein
MIVILYHTPRSVDMSGRVPPNRAEITEIGDLYGVGEARKRALREIGVESLDDLAAVDVETLTEVDGIGLSLAHRMKEEATAVVPAERTRAASTAPRREWRVTDTAARFLSERSGVDRERLRGELSVDIADRLGDLIDPSHFLYRKVCGRVVKRDSATGELHPVPNATVHVEDTDCSFLGYFPDPYPWGWLFPFNCRRETVAEVKTDECGKFCVYVPRWDIDRVVRFRREHVCLDELFIPRIRDLLERLPHVPEPVPDPWDRLRPRPRPRPFPNRFDARRALDAVGGIVEPAAVERLEDAVMTVRFAESTADAETVLDAPAFPGSTVKPPLPPDLLREGAVDLERVTESLLERADLPREYLEELEFTRYVGPVFPCREVIVPEWSTFVDVPDITFRVTQDVDGDGEEEGIYDEGFFEVRWDADSLGDVTLEADGNALAVDGCGLPPIDESDCDRPDLLVVGRMPLEPDYHDEASGYALRVNRPKVVDAGGSVSRTPAETPYRASLQLSGCIRTEEGGRYYRLRYAYGDADPVSFTNVTWTAAVMGGGPPVAMQPVDGEWYDIQVLDTLVEPNWLFNWNTRNYPDGKYTIYVDVADDARNVLETSDPISFVVDNSAPTVAFGRIEWAEGGETVPTTGWQTIVQPGAGPTTCPKIERSGDQTVYLRVSYTASAAHLRDVSLGASGCSSAAQPARLPGADEGDYGHWHENGADNSYAQTGVFVIEPSDAAGAYDVTVTANGRAFSPAGSGGPGDQWLIDPVHVRRRLREGISLIDG